MNIVGILVIALVVSACASTAEDEAEVRTLKLVNTNVQLAVEYMQRGQLEYAKENVERALALDRDNSNANHIAALLWIRLKDMDKAESYFERAVKLDPKNSEAENNFGVFVCGRGRYLDAIKHFDAALLNPLYKTPEAAAENAGLCLMKAHRASRAETYFRKALNYQPRSGKALLGLAKVSYTRGRMLSARGFLQRYFAAAKDTPEALLLAVKVERALGAKDQQASYELRLKGKFPDSREAQEIR
ncbi:MAG: type IV pilus biogenesis/stability protein PilW [Gammaproteobacteria bacterium]|nr:type IV pilus biogenesis/stability protein PilW [Gammaproteobacteria bacterium]